MFKKRNDHNLETNSATGVDATAAEAAFPPLGTTLPSPMYGQNYGQPYGQAGQGYGGRPPVTVIPATKPKRNWRRIIKRTFVSLIIVGVLACVYVGAKFVINAGMALDGNLFGLLQNDKLKGEDEGRVNILLAGNSADDPGHGGADLTDSVMVVSIDIDNNRAFMLSIPRDMWVESPASIGGDYTKINAVYQYGEAEEFSEPGYAPGGMGALQKVVSRNFGIELHYYALVNYTAFRDAVNAVGGIDVTIDSEDPRGLYDAMIAKVDGGPLRLANGPQHLDGQTALNLARARGSGYSYGFASSDFTRTEHQRMMLVALKEKAATASVLANPIKLGSLLDSFGSNVKTDFKTNEMRRLYDLSKKIPAASITSVGLNDVDGKSLLRSYNASGQSTLIPAAGIDDYSDIQAHLEVLMTPPPPPSPSASEE